MDELCYFTNRDIGQGSVKAWVYRGMCPKCGKSKMGKPKKNGKVAIRAEEYECPSCKFVMEKEAYEDTLNCEVKYVCPKCKHNGDIAIPFLWKKVKVFDLEKQKDVAAKGIVFKCEKCQEKIAITKRMK